MHCARSPLTPPSLRLKDDLGALSPCGIRSCTENFTRLVCWLDRPASPSSPTPHTFRPPLPPVLFSATTDTSKSTTVKCPEAPPPTSIPLSVSAYISAPIAPPPSFFWAARMPARISVSDASTNSATFMGLPLYWTRQGAPPCPREGAPRQPARS